MTRLLTEAEAERLLEDAQRFRSRVVVDAEPVDASGTWTTARGDELHAKPGDWWVADGDDRWSVDGDIFRATYTMLDDGRYRKVATVVAVQLDHEFAVTTLEGEASGAPGDWLVRNDSGESWPIGADVFARRYEPV